jgi:hypothetical protein
MCPAVTEPGIPAAVFRRRLLGAIWVLALLPSYLSAKDAPLNAIVLYDTPTGAAYVQVTGVLLNGKDELRGCPIQNKINRATYGQLVKVHMGGSASLERGTDGVFNLTRDDQSRCVLPSNLHLEGEKEYTPAELADQAVLQGAVVSASQGQPNELPALKPGVRLVFVASPDSELAEFLRAQRANSISGWQQFLAHGATPAHVAAAKSSLAELLESSAEAAFAQYQKPTLPPLWASLKQANQLAKQAIQIVPGYAPATKMLGQIHAVLERTTVSNRGELTAYRKAVQDQTAGYAHLTAAKRLNDQILEVDESYTPALELQSDLIKEQSTLDAVVQKAEALLAANRPDEALAQVLAYRSLATELPRVDAIITAACAFHLNRGKEAGVQEKWYKAVTEFGKSLEIRPESEEAGAALKDAQAQVANAHNREVAAQAAEQSQALADQKQYIEAYEALADLPDAQRTLVADKLEALEANFVPAALQRAHSLQEVHIPIRGRADEDAVRQAYHLLGHASSLSDDPGIKLRRDLIADKISAYYVEQAKRYLEKPVASGVALGWCYLLEAERYKPNLDAVKDAMSRYEPSYKARGNFSVGVEIRDQTSRRESGGIADQFADAISSDLENSGLPVRVVRQTPQGIQPLFRIIGEINEYRKARNSSVETLQSKYRAGIVPEPNEAWLKAKHDYESAEADATKAQNTLDRIPASKKKELAASKEVVQAARKKADDLRSKMDATEQSRAKDVIEDYNYTKTTIDLTGIISAAFRVIDLTDSLVEPTLPVKQESHKVFYILEGVQPTDTEGVKAQNAPPDEGEFMTDLESRVRDALSKSVHDKVLDVPAKILGAARKFSEQNDVDAAGEWYVIYLNSIRDNSTAEGQEALKFLADHFNVAPGPLSTAAAPTH